MKKRLTKVIFTVPFMALDLFGLPAILLYWIIKGEFLEGLTQQLWES